MYARVEKLSLFIVEISEASGIGSLVYFASIDRIFKINANSTYRGDAKSGGL